jgi:serine/threonine-protein kinase
VAELNLIGKYEIRRELGRGAMGVVYEAYDTLIKRVVALKTIRADQLTGDTSENIVARFRREAQAAGRLNHPNIVSIYDFGEEEGVWYIAMEYVKGRELKDYFQANERFTTGDIVRIMTKILDADYSHARRHSSRHQAANIFLQEDGTVKVADFGIAHIETSNMTQVGTAIGTPAYMSPEQIQGMPIDGRSDLFSAGVILYQFLTGERPFGGSSTTTMRKVLEEDPLPPSRFNVQVPAAMDAVVRRALAKRADDRFQSARVHAGDRRSAGAGTIALRRPPGGRDGLNAAADRAGGGVGRPPTPAYASREASQSTAMASGVAIGRDRRGGWYGYMKMSGGGAVTQAAAPTAPARRERLRADAGARSPPAPRHVPTAAPPASPHPPRPPEMITAVGPSTPAIRATSPTSH